MNCETGSIADALLERHQALATLRLPWETLWKEIADYVMPRRSQGMNGGTLAPSVERESRLFDTTAVQANMILANGCLAWMSPQESPWFGYEPPQGRDSDVARRWLSDATERTRQAMALSNFYTSIHEFYLDRSAFGTAALYVEPGTKSALNVQCWPVGTFVIDEDAEGNVDTVIREFELTVRQAMQKFGEKCSARVRDLAGQGGAKLHEKVKFLHCICPRTREEMASGSDAQGRMPVASVYLERESRHVCRVSGYEEMPVMVSRYLEWGSGLGALYGWSPAFSALPEARQVNFLQKMMDALAEKMAFPPVMAPDELEGEIDSSAGGVTYFDRTLAATQAMPREWQTTGHYDVGLERVRERQGAINRAFHTELFQMFSQIEKQMTAREVAERASEKLIQFSPTFSRMTVELFNPLMERLFGILLRSGKFGDVPREMLEAHGNGMGFVPVPDVHYTSRIAQSLRATHSVAMQRTVELVSAIAPMEPSVVKHFDWGGAIREDALNNGMPAKFVRPLDEVQEEMAAEAEAAMMAQQQQQAAMAVEGASKVGRIPADSPVGQKVSQALEAAEAAA
jgi:hypothetical protein